MSPPRPRPALLDLRAYVGGTSKVAGLSKVYKLSSNEAALGPSPKARAAYEGLRNGLEVYPEGGATDLRDAIAQVHGIEANRIVCGNGSDEILTFLASAYLQPGDEAIYSKHGFVYYPMVIKAAGATPVIADETDFTANVDALLACVTDKTRMVFLANPNNPTGTYLDRNEVTRLAKALPPHVILVLDAAYAEFVTTEDYESGLHLVSKFDNVVMTRTFSKIYGLASLRVGWAYCPPAIADILNRLRGPFNVNTPAQTAATHAVRDIAFTDKARAYNEEQLAMLSASLTQSGLSVTPSVCNFLLLHFPQTTGKTAADADAFLQKRGLLLRRLEEYHLPNALRLTVGSPEANKKVCDALFDFLNG